MQNNAARGACHPPPPTGVKSNPKWGQKYRGRWAKSPNQSSNMGRGREEQGGGAQAKKEMPAQREALPPPPPDPTHLPSGEGGRREGGEEQVVAGRKKGKVAGRGGREWREGREGTGMACSTTVGKLGMGKQWLPGKVPCHFCLVAHCNHQTEPVPPGEVKIHKRWWQVVVVFGRIFRCMIPSPLQGQTLCRSKRM